MVHDISIEVRSQRAAGYFFTLGPTPIFDVLTIYIGKRTYFKKKMVGSRCLAFQVSIVWTFYIGFGGFSNSLIHCYNI